MSLVRSMFCLCRRRVQAGVSLARFPFTLSSGVSLLRLWTFVYTSPYLAIRSAVEDFRELVEEHLDEGADGVGEVEAAGKEVVGLAALVATFMSSRSAEFRSAEADALGWR